MKTNGIRKAERQTSYAVLCQAHQDWKLKKETRKERKKKWSSAKKKTFIARQLTCGVFWFFLWPSAWQTRECAGQKRESANFSLFLNVIILFLDYCCHKGKATPNEAFFMGSWNRYAVRFEAGWLPLTPFRTCELTTFNPYAFARRDIGQLNK